MAAALSSLEPFLQRLSARVEISPADKDAILALPQRVRLLEPHEHFVRQGDVPTHCCLMIDGFTVREKVVSGGARQILAVHMKGEMVDLQNVLLEVSDHNVRALTSAKVVVIPRTAMEEMAFTRPSVGKALWLETLVDGSVFREWITNVGRRDAKMRIAHLLCEFAVRLKAAGLATAAFFELPMTQDDLADALGLTSVHVNRTLKALRNEGLIEQDGRSVRINDWNRLTKMADFSPQYLHLPKNGSGTPH